MQKTDPRYNSYISVLKAELVPAAGCTEPIAIAFAAAKARTVLGKMPDRVHIVVSGNIIKTLRASSFRTPAASRASVPQRRQASPRATISGSSRSLRASIRPAGSASANFSTPCRSRSIPPKTTRSSIST